MGIPSGLTQRVRAGHGVLVAGLGFADVAASSAWEATLRRLIQRFATEGDDAKASARLVLDLVSRGRLRSALAWLRQRLPERAVTEVLAELRLSGSNVPPAVTLAAQLPWRGVVTTNFDDGWERTFKNGHPGGRPFRRLDPRVLAEGLLGEDADTPFLLHALGTPQAPETLCLSAADLRRRDTSGAVGAFLRSVFAERSFVFLGFRPGDPDLGLILENMLGSAPTSAEHFFLFPETSGELEAALQAEILGAELDLTPVPYLGTLEELLRGWVVAAEEAITPRPIVLKAPASAASSEDSGPADLLIKGDHAEWVREQRARIDAAPVAERAPLYERMGDVYREKLGSPVQAISCYRSSLQHEPGRRSVLAKLAELYTAHKHWRAAEEALVKLAHTEPTPERRAQFLCRAAGIAGEELDNPVRAAQLLDRALDDVPDMAEAFEALERLLTQERNWQALARLYQRTVRELPTEGGGRALKLRAATGLAELGLKFSKDPKVALRALEAAEVLDPGNADRKAQMAGLYVQAGPAHLDKAIAMHHALVALDPDRLTSYRALADLYRTTGDRDRLWCVAATLSFLRKADEDLREVYERGKGARTGPVSGPFTAETWELVTHPDEDAGLAALFVLLGGVLAGRNAETPQALGLRPEERVDLAWDDRVCTRSLLTSCRWLEIRAPELYCRMTDRRPVALQVLRSGPEIAPALVLGAPLLTKPDANEVTFTIARQVVLLRPEKVVAALEAGRELARVAVEAALYLAGLRPLSDPLRALVEEFCGELRALLPQPTKDALSVASRELLARHHGEVPDIGRWCNAIELTAARAAFALVNDLGVAARALAADPAAPHRPSAKQRLKDLVGFSVSERYFQARRALGLSRVA
jgi:tetratricopeptide (TPR) repeat protein